ncbi:CBS domain-containing protein [Blastococcus sp. SYSU D00695]
MSPAGPAPQGAAAPGPLVGEVMVRMPKVLPATASVADVRAVLADDHVVMALLTDGGRLRGTLLREDLPPDAPPSTPALGLSRLAGRTVSPAEPLAAVHRRLLAEGVRRLAVVDDDGRLLGLVCLKRRRDGFCSDAGIAARARAAGRAR